MKKFKSHLVFSRSQRNGIFLLVLLIIVLQVIYFLGNRQSSPGDSQPPDPELAVFQKKIDSIRNASRSGDTVKIYPFNPNFITDYRGYTLGLTVEEIDKLHSYRKQDQWVNSAEDFQRVTGVDDSTLTRLSPYFRFPEWVNTSRPAIVSDNKTNSKVEVRDKQDLNSASVEDLVMIKGIGEILAGRIVNYRSKIGGFIDNLQLKDIYGLNYETRNEVLAHFSVRNAPLVEKININSAGLLELSNIPYINYELAREIINFRLLNGNIGSFEELAKIKEFPSEKIDRIALYLTLE